MTRSPMLICALVAGPLSLAPAAAQSPAEDDRPLAIPSDTSTPEPRAPKPDDSRDQDYSYRPSPNAPKVKEPRAGRSESNSFLHTDVGYRLIWSRNSLMPIRQRAGALGDRPHMMHGLVGGMMDRKLYAAVSYEMPVNYGQGSFPFVAEARFGWWDNFFGEPERRGAFGAIAGTAITYVGVRWVHDYFRGSGREWAGTGSAGGLVLGYTRSAPFGKLTIVSDSHFSLYLLGWSERPDFPLGLLNQRISVGFDPVFLDVRFRFDPGTGDEISVGLSMQSLF
ncbi:MAG: hypothetical protein EA397_05095 [Deltaproteobacteria bacterium]|nr:MAG: hypothetical protein EA397_05095 [Deltaproteobacteria bacterium]